MNKHVLFDIIQCIIQYIIDIILNKSAGVIQHNIMGNI